MNRRKRVKFMQKVGTPRTQLPSEEETAYLEDVHLGDALEDELLQTTWNQCSDVLVFMRERGVDLDLAPPILMMGIARLAALSGRCTGAQAWKRLTKHVNHQGFLAMFEIQAQAIAAKCGPGSNASDERVIDESWTCARCGSTVVYQREPGPCPQCGATKDGTANAACNEGSKG